jgi:hypothetical protein
VQVRCRDDQASTPPIRVSSAEPLVTVVVGGVRNLVILGVPCGPKASLAAYISRVAPLSPTLAGVAGTVFDPGAVQPWKNR